MSELYRDGLLQDGASIPDEQVIDWSRLPMVTPLEAIFQAQKKELPPEVAANLSRYAFEKVDFTIIVKVVPGTTFPVSVAMDMCAIPERPGFDIQSGLPGPEWTDSGLSIDVDMALTFARKFVAVPAKNAPSPVNPNPNPNPNPNDPGIGIDTGVRIKFSYHPKIATVQAVYGGHTTSCRFSNKPGQGLDGQFNFSLFTARVRESRRNMICAQQISVVYAKPYSFFKDEYIVRNKMIDISVS